MGRLFAAIAAAALIFGAIAWSQGMFASVEAGSQGQANAANATPKKDWGPRLVGDKVEPIPPIKANSGADPTIFVAHLNVIDEADVPSRQDGKLMFVGYPVQRGEEGFNQNRFFDVPVGKDTKRIYFRPLKDNDPLRQNQIVAVVDPTLIYTKVGVQQAKVTASEADYKGADALYKAYREELERLDTMRAKFAKGVSEQEYNVARAQKDKYYADSISKKEAITVAYEELAEATTMMQLHFMRNTVVPSNGAPYNPDLIRIKTVYKKSGESVKNLDPVLHIYNIGWLRAEGLVDGQYLSGIHEKMKVSVEPTYVRKPVRTFHGHRQGITCVAVSSDDKNPLIVTGGEDNTVRVWKRTLPTEFCVLTHPAPVRAVACSPRKDKGNRNLCLTACADGSVRLWDLDKLSSNPSAVNKPIWEKDDQHNEGINCIAFSPDGTMYATGGDDNAISLWKTVTGEKIYKFDEESGHQGAVTSLHITPDLKVISAGRDNTLRVWTLCENGADLDEKRLLTNRTGGVTHLGVDPKGRWMLFDQGRKLQIIAQIDGRTVGMIQDPADSSPFENFAVVSPDSSLVLTTSASEGRLQLWSAPTDGTRSFEVRQFKAKESGQVSCAAFGIDTTLPETRAEDAQSVFAVTGTKDGLLHLWAVPAKEKIAEEKLTGEVSLKDAYVDPTKRQARVWVDVKNEKAVLKPGDSVTIVVEPRGTKSK